MLAIARRADQNLMYYKETGRRFGDTNGDLYSLQTIVEACKAAKQTAAASKYDAIFQKHLNALG